MDGATDEREKNYNRQLTAVSVYPPQSSNGIRMVPRHNQEMGGSCIRVPSSAMADQQSKLVRDRSGYKNPHLSYAASDRCSMMCTDG